jgi:hypothetical protein
VVYPVRAAAALFATLVVRLSKVTAAAVVVVVVIHGLRLWWLRLRQARCLQLQSALVALGL